MAIVRDNNKWNADLLTDLTSSGSDDGVTADTVAWAVDQNNWYYPNVINASTSTWTAVASGGAIAQSGIITDDLRFFVDFNNQSSWEPNQTTTWTDTIAALPGTATNIAITDGHLNFNGTTSDTDFGVLSSELENLFAGGGTVLVWVRTESDGEGNFARIVDTQQSVTTKGWTLYVRNESGGSLDYALQIGTTPTPNNWETTAAVSLNEWVMVAMTFDSGSVQTAPVIYVNGVSVGVTVVSDSNTTYNSDAGDNLLVGNNSANTRTFDGDIEMVALFDTVKSASEIADIYNTTKARFGIESGGGGGGALTGLPGNIYEDLQFYVDPADRNSFPATGGTTITDLEGNGTSGTLSSAGLFADGAFTFTGTASENITFTKGAALDNIFAGGGTTVAFIRPYAPGGGGFGRIMDTSDTTNEGWLWWVEAATSGTLKFGLNRQFTTTDANWVTSDITDAFGDTDGALRRGNWVCVAITYDDTTTTPKFYLNGEEVSVNVDLAPVGSAISDVGNPLIIGNRSDTARAFDGQIGPLFMFDRVLSAMELQQVTGAFAPRDGIGLRGLDTPGASDPVSGQNINLRGGDGTDTNAESWGGHLLLQAGDQTNSGAGAAGAGKVLLRSGDQTSTTSQVDSSEVLIESGASSSGSKVTLRVGDQSTTNAVGLLTIHGGDNASSGAGGSILLESGSLTGGAGTPGDITLTPGTDTGSAIGDLVLSYATWPPADGTTGQVLSTNGSGVLSWAAGGGGGGSTAWSEETTQTTDATVGVTIATPISPVTDGTQHSVEVLITAESGGSNTYFRRQVFTYYRDGGGAVQWTTEINGAEARRGLTTATAGLSVSGNDVLVTATGEVATAIDWTIQYRTTNTITSGGTVSTTGIVRETVDTRGSALTTGTAVSGGSVDFTISAGAAYVTLQFLRVVTATGTCADATIQFFRDAARTDEIYDAQNKDPSTQYADRVPGTMVGNDGTGLASNTLYGRIGNNDAGDATFDVEVILWGVV